jgi:hypothetical protein
MVGLTYLKTIRGSAQIFYAAPQAEVMARCDALEKSLAEGDDAKGNEKLDLLAAEQAKEAFHLLSKGRQGKTWLYLTPTFHTKAITPLKLAVQGAAALAFGALFVGVSRSSGEPPWITGGFSVLCGYFAQGNYKITKANLTNLDSPKERQKWQELSKKIPLEELLNRLEKHQMVLDKHLKKLEVKHLIRYRFFEQSEPVYLSEGRRALFYAAIHTLSKEFESLKKVHQENEANIRQAAKSGEVNEKLEAARHQRTQASILLEKQFRALEASLRTS